MPGGLSAGGLSLVGLAGGRGAALVFACQREGTLVKQPGRESEAAAAYRKAIQGGNSYASSDLRNLTADSHGARAKRSGAVLAAAADLQGRMSAQGDSPRGPLLLGLP
jgi:hypothetical protein